MNWNITKEGHLTVTGSGDYKLISSSYDDNEPEWTKYRQYIRTATINVQNITSTADMFYGCSSLTTLDLSNFDTSNVTDMGSMFYGCSSLATLNLSNFHTNNVKSMYNMFSECSSLVTLDLSTFDTTNVTSMTDMFSGCSSLATLNLSSFNTNNVNYMGGMFFRCSSLATLDLSNFRTNNLTEMGSMFFRCSSLVTLNLSTFDTKNVTKMDRMVARCSSLATLNLSNFDTNNVKYMEYMFYGCSSLTTLDISNFNANNIEDMQHMFGECSALEKLSFFANAPYGVYLPSTAGYYWINENNEKCTDATKLDRKMIYTRVKGTFTPPITYDANTGIYSDSSCTTLAPLSTRTHFVNGGNVKQADSTRINYKTKYYYTKLQASNIVTTDKKGKTKTTKGKLVVGITSSSTIPTLVKGKITDSSVSKIASASISKNKITVTAKSQPGTVYLWVMDTGNVKAYAYAKIIIKAAPSKLQIFAASSNSAGFSADSKNVYKKDYVELGKTIKLYLYPSYTFERKVTETKDASYSVSVQSQSSSYFTAVQDPSDPYCFNVTAKALKNNKKTSGQIIITCNENGRKATFTATAVNSVQSINFTSVTGMTNDTALGTVASEFKIEKSDANKNTGSFVISTGKSDNSFETTDNVKLYAMGSADGFDKAQMDKGKVRITARPDSSQKKLTAKLDKDKKTVVVTAAKKIPVATSVYYLIMYNNKENTGYKVVKLTTI